MGHIGTILSISITLYAAVAIIFLISENRRPQATLAWMLVFMFLPGIGVLIYILFGSPLCQGSCPSLYFRLYFSGGRDRPMTWHTQKNAGQRS